MVYCKKYKLNNNWLLSFKFIQALPVIYFKTDAGNDQKV